MKRYIADDICQDLTISRMKFFRADTKKLFSAMLELAKAGIRHHCLSTLFLFPDCRLATFLEVK